jgi:hypothetical protein
MKKTCRQMLLRSLLTGIGILFLTGLQVSGQELYSFNRKTINWGLKAGLNANAIMYFQIMQGDEEVKNVSFRNKSGYDLTGFFRINLDRFFIQPEIGWGILNKDISFSLPSHPEYPQLLDMSLKSQTANINGLIGYNITRTGPFTFNVLTGISLRYRFETWYSFHDLKGKYNITSPAYNAFGVVGFSMNISNLHFDIRYTVGFWPANLTFDETPDKPEWLAGTVFYKNENILGFSCGLMF